MSAAYKTPEFAPIPDYADVFKISDFNPKFYSPYDGNGYWGTDTEMSNLDIHIVIEKPSWATTIIWFNK